MTGGTNRHADIDGPHTHTASQSAAHIARLEADWKNKHGTLTTVLPRRTSADRCLAIWRYRGEPTTAPLDRPDRAQMDAEIKSRRETNSRFEIEAGPACG